MAGLYSVVYSPKWRARVLEICPKTEAANLYEVPVDGKQSAVRQKKADAFSAQDTPPNGIRRQVE